jgi:PAS domain S-box-containing protein
MKEELRKIGIDIVGDVPWGTHLVQFYQTKKDLMDILGPYFKAGLENNEFCLWVTSKSLSEKEAGKAMRKTVSDFDQYLDSGQMEIVPYTKWYVKNGKFNSKRVLNGWNEKMNQARDKGLCGLRVAGDTGWLEKKDRRKFIDYEIEFNRTISQYPCIAICTYPLGHWEASEILDLIGNHKSALIKRRGKWEFIESHGLERVEETLRKRGEEALCFERQRFQTLSEYAPIGLMMFDQEGIFRYLNPKFKELFGYDLTDVPDRRTWFRKAYPNPTYRHQVISAWKNDSERFKQGEKTPKIFTVTCKDGTQKIINYLPVQLETGDFFTACEDITERKRTEGALRRSEQRMGILNQIAHIFLTVPENEMYGEVLAVVLKILKSPYGIFGFIEDNGDLIIPSMTRGIWDKCRVPEKSIVFPSHTWGDSLWGRSIREKRTYYSSGPFQTPEGHIHIDNFLTVPIVFGDETIGLICVANKEGGFTEEDKNLLESIVLNISPILHAKLQRGRQERERKRAEELLLDSEARFRQLFDEAPMGYHEIDTKGQISRVNRTELNMLGYSAEEMLGKPVWEFVADADSRKAVMSKLAGVNPPGYQFERTYRRKDGTLVPVMIMERILVNENGQIKMIRSTIQDITERKQTEELLRKSEEKYRTLFEESKDAIFITTPDGKFLDINPAGVRLLGYSSREDLLKADIPEEFYFHPEDRERLERTLAEQGFVKDYELTLRKKNGETLNVLETATAVRDEQGNIVAYRGIMRDVTEKKNLEQQFLQSQKMEAIGILAGGVAHDFNNLLMVIQGNVELGLMKIDRSNPLYEVLMKVREGTKRASDLTQQLLSFSRRRVLHPRILNVADLIGDLSKMLSRVIGEDIELKIEFGLNLGHIYVDPNALDQVLMNLVVNARNAMPQGGVLYIQAQNAQLDEGFCRHHPDVTPGEYVQISVVDTGTGMDENTLQRIFEPFFTTREQGTGLGLAMVYGIVKQHNGHIIVSSQLEKGSRFDIYLPLRRESLIHEVLESENVLPRGRETILLAEDEKEVRELLKLFLESLGYTVLPACDGEEALEIFSTLRDQIDLVILDAVMPKISGPQVIEQMRTLSPNLNCFLLTGYSEEIIQRYFDQELEIPVLRKPITFHELGRKVREALD